MKTSIVRRALDEAKASLPLARTRKPRVRHDTSLPLLLVDASRGQQATFAIAELNSSTCFACQAPTPPGDRGCGYCTTRERYTAYRTLAAGGQG